MQVSAIYRENVSCLIQSALALQPTYTYRDLTAKLSRPGADGLPKHLRDISGFNFVAESRAVWLLGDVHVQYLIPKFLNSRQRYLELAVFTGMEYFFKDKMYMSEVATELAEMFCLHDHVPQVILVVAGSDDLGIFSKAQIRARAQDMVTDMLAVWDKVCPEP